MKSEKTNRIERSELYNEIYDIVKQIPREKVQGDAMDAPSAAYELEQLFLKKLNLPDVTNCTNEEIVLTVAIEPNSLQRFLNLIRIRKFNYDEHIVAFKNGRYLYDRANSRIKVTDVVKNKLH